MGHVDGTFSAPPQLVDGQPNPAYYQWYERDQYVLSWINFSLSEAVLPIVVNKFTAYAAWSALATIYASGSKVQVRHLSKALHQLRRGDTSIHDYLQDAKTKADQLAALGSPVNNDDLTGWILDGLGEDYRPFVRHIEARLEPISFEDLHSLLLSEELQIKRFSARSDSPSPAAFYSNAGGFRGRGGRGRGRGFPRGGGRLYSHPNLFVPSVGRSNAVGGGVLGPRPAGVLVTCHNCGGRGHIKPNCPSPLISPTLSAHSASSTGQASHNPFPSPHTHFASSSAHAFNPQQWLLDSGTNHHLTSDLDNLAHHSEYNGTDQVTFGNGNSLPISHSGASKTSLSHFPISLDNILRVRNAPFNLLSISSLTRTNPISIEFFDTLFVIKDRSTGNELYRGYAVDGLYALPLQISRRLSPLACVATLHVWHQRLGHANERAVKQALSHHQIKFLSNSPSLCHGCSVSKIHKLPFSSSTFCASAPLELVCSDVWGPAPTLSYDGQSYYILFYDHYSKFSWIYFVRYKSQLLSVFNQFRQLVEKFFGTPIKTFQSDWGGEYQALSTYLRDNGIAHRSSCPYTPEQNGCAERKHRHIVNNGLALLHHAHVPQKYWSLAFDTACYLINRTPTPLLDHDSPFHFLFKRLPDISNLRVFGCLCYPWLRPLTSNKLDPRSLPCVFLGYSKFHKGYRCLHIPTGRIYINRHVLFDESRFPFAELISPHSPTVSLPSPSPIILPSLPTIPPSATIPRPTNSPSTQPTSPVYQPNTEPISPPLNQPVPDPTSQPLTQPVPDSTSQPLTQPDPDPNTQPSPDPIPDPSSSSASPAPPASHTRRLISPAAPLRSPPPTPLLQYHRRRPPLTSAAPVSPVSSSFRPTPLPPPRPLAPRPRFTTSPRPLPITNPTSSLHPMVTRIKTGHLKPKALLSHLPTDDTPRTVAQALRLPHWRAAMSDEVSAQIRNHTWDLVPAPPDCNILSNKWVYRTKIHPDGSLDRHRARLVARGFEQIPGLDFDQTYSPVLKPATLRLILGLAVTQGWPLHQIDVANAFLHGQLQETVYMQQPPGFVDPDRPDYVCRLRKSIYGLRQAPQTWFQCLAAALGRFGFSTSRTDPSLFIYKSSAVRLYMLVYVDDIVITGNDNSTIQRLMVFLRDNFALREMGALSYFLGIEVHRTSSGIVLSQRKFILDLLDRAHMSTANPISTPCTLDIIQQAAQDNSPLFADPSLYRSLVGGLQYLSFTRPDISFAVNHVSQYQHAPTDTHWAAVKRILRYLRGTIDRGMEFSRSSSLHIHGYSDSSWASCPKDRKSITGFAVFCGSNLISWSTRKQKAVARSSTECEYRALATLASEVLWLRNLLHELGQSIPAPPVLWCDNLGATFLAHNPVFHNRSKHMEIEFHFVRDHVSKGQLRVHFLPATDQLADVLTKPLPRVSFTRFCSKFRLTEPQFAGA
ncbi:unnamed protein product [Linum trigynum]|uniref:Retrovirus-related Pol polyprotein from transposon TNT 1-94 n=1 Tax=Linum trigynum TaxID=586398 RepID=A0AAV2G0E3_9ROSI